MSLKISDLQNKMLDSLKKSINILVKLFCLFSLLSWAGMVGCKHENITEENNEPLLVQSSDPVFDVDGNIYQTVRIGDQTWMAENLKTTHFKDGEQIPLVIDDPAWGNLNSPGYCFLNNDIENKHVYGAFYNWYAVQTGILAPEGWHVPSDEEWMVLADYLGGEGVAGGKMKAAGLGHWSSPNHGATNSSGFSALPAGGRGGESGIFQGYGLMGNFWSSTEYSRLDAWRRHLVWDDQNLRRDLMGKSMGFSVRCVKNSS